MRFLFSLPIFSFAPVSDRHWPSLLSPTPLSAPLGSHLRAAPPPQVTSAAHVGPIQVDFSAPAGKILRKIPKTNPAAPGVGRSNSRDFVVAAPIFGEFEEAKAKSLVTGLDHESEKTKGSFETEKGRKHQRPWVPPFLGGLASLLLAGLFFLLDLCRPRTPWHLSPKRRQLLFLILMLLLLGPGVTAQPARVPLPKVSPRELALIIYSFFHPRASIVELLDWAGPSIHWRGQGTFLLRRIGDKSLRVFESKGH